MNENFEDLLKEEEINELKKGKVLEGVLLNKSSDGIWVALDATGDVFVKREELLKNISEYKIGEKITVKVIKTNDAEGFNTASEKRAQAEKLMDEIEEGSLVNVKFESRAKNGYIVLIENAIKAFLPGSLSMLRPEDEMPKDSQRMKVIQKRGRKVVVSKRDAVEESIKEVYENYKENMIVEGIIESIKDFGAFVKLNEHVTALIPRSEVSWDKNTRINKQLSEGEKVRGVIINLDKNAKKISMSLKQLKEDPWEDVEKKYPIGSVQKGNITKLFPFGFTVKLENAVEGLVHESEIFWGRKGKIADIASEGDRVEVKVLDIDKGRNRISLSYKQALGNPWEEAEEKYLEGNIVNGIVEKILANGAIIKLEEGLTGFLHVSELSWNFVDNVEDVLKEGEKIKVKILNLDKENQKIKLSLKQAKENPWKLISEKVQKGDILTGKITRFVDKGAVVLINDYEVEAFMPGSKATENRTDDIKEVLEVGSPITGKVLDIEFQSDQQRGNLVLSVLDYIKEKEKEEGLKIMEEMNSEEE
ncbi:MAG: small subunit ribosomal protein [Oceanotoga sp.]|uniref:S1 RNA-binding domain-containing protein n=1 Tax=Oceanotoga sp. TaxID=2108366 RepID=UPI002652D8F5|nr:S1 RNA-binding domain-containing protein [Oceanotoga sp.]MDN5341681.1 small subunit ribosomal protein [Oceanotoga sp.]